MTNLQIMIPGFRSITDNGKGHQYWADRRSPPSASYLVWRGWTEPLHPGTRFTDPNYYGHWQYMPSHNINSLPANPDFFQIINYAMNRVNGGATIQSPKNVPGRSGADRSIRQR